MHAGPGALERGVLIEVSRKPTMLARSRRWIGRTRGPASAALVVIGAASVLLGGATPAMAAPPPNDPQGRPQVVTLPADVAGTTAESTVEPTEPPAACAATSGTVWYAFTAPASERVVARLRAGGDLDAQLSVFLRQRSQAQPLGCDRTDERGLAQLAFRTTAGADYLVRVEQRANSVAGTFRLAIFRPQPAARPPGLRLARRGVRGTVDSVENTEDAYAARLRGGKSYRVNLAAGGQACTRLQVFGPGTRSFDAGAPLARAGCDGYLLFTPQRNGTYSLLVSAAPASHRPQRYHVQLAAAGRDDTAPGVFLRNFARERGRLNGRRIDVVDLFRFDVTARSELTLDLSSRGDRSFSVVLFNNRGRRIQCACFDTGGTQLRRRLAPGRYFAAVRARDHTRGAYTLRRISRTITRTSVAIGGRTHTRIAPGRPTIIRATVSPAVSGPVSVVVERFDPLAGWQFLRRFATRAVRGRASIAWRPPSVGRFRAHARFAGTRGAAASDSGLATLLVAGPLRQ
jgi:hypothetical protein